MLRFLLLWNVHCVPCLSVTPSASSTSSTAVFWACCHAQCSWGSTMSWRWWWCWSPWWFTTSSSSRLDPLSLMDSVKHYTPQIHWTGTNSVGSCGGREPWLGSVKVICVKLCAMQPVCIKWTKFDCDRSCWGWLLIRCKSRRGRATGWDTDS